MAKNDIVELPGSGWDGWRRMFGLTLTLAMTAIIGVVAAGQTFRGGISGTVTDNTGAAITGVSVKVTSRATAAVRTAETTSSGEFTIPELPLGFYTIEVGRQGFQSQRVNDVEVTVSRTTRVDLQLSVAQVSEVVEISAGAVVRLDTASTALTGLVAPRQVQDLPLNGRRLPGSL